MLRRAVTFLAAVVVVGAVASLVYLNSQPTTLRWGPQQELTVPLAWLILGSTVAGALLMFFVLLAREGHWAMRHWRLVRALRGSERAAKRRSEARASALAGRHGKARALLEKTATGRAANIDDAVDYGEAFLAEGRAAEGRTHLEDSRRELGDDPRILYALARCCRELGDGPAAVAALERAVEALPASIALHTMLRDCLVELEWWPHAEKAQQRVVDLRPADPDEKQHLIDIRMKAAELGDASERETALAGVLAMDPSWPAAAAGRAALLAEQGKRRAAVRVLYKAAKRRPAAQTLRALDTTLEDGNARQLLRLYRRLRRAHPGNSEVALHLAAQLVRAGRNAEADLLLSEFDGTSEREAVFIEMLRARMQGGETSPQQISEALRRTLEEPSGA